MIGNFIIFGDSYSTHKDHIPAGYPTYYSSEGQGENKEATRMLPEETWWGRVAKEGKGTLLLNDSWSGSTIGYTGYAGDCSTSSSFIYRYLQLLEKGFFRENRVDTVFVFGGTNDSWSNAPLGELQFADITREDLFCVLPAICYFMQRLKADLPHCRVVFLSNCGIKPQIMEGMARAGENIGVSVVQLSKIDKVAGHPTSLGMEQICQQILENF